MTHRLANPPCPAGTPVVARRCGSEGPAATEARLDRGHLRVRLADGVELLRAPAWLRAEGDGRDPVEVLLRPCGTTLAITWRDGRRRRFDVSWLRTAEAHGQGEQPNPLGGMTAPTAAAHTS